MTKFFKATLLIITVSMLITNCSTAASTESTAAVPATATNEPTATSEPTATTQPTSMPEPTATPEPTTGPVSEFESLSDEERVDTLFDAIRDNDPVTVSELLAVGTDVNAVRGIFTPIIVATTRNNPEIFTLLLEAGADATVIDNTDNNLLHHAARRNGIEIATILLTLDGVDIDHVRNDGGPDSGATPLLLAAFEGNLEMVELLVAHGADIDAVDERGDTPLNVAVWNGKFEVVQKLVELGAKTDVINSEGDGALDHARSTNRDEIEAFLLTVMEE